MVLWFVITRQVCHQAGHNYQRISEYSEYYGCLLPSRDVISTVYKLSDQRDTLTLTPTEA